MNRVTYTLLFMVLLLVACSPSLASTEAPPGTPTTLPATEPAAVTPAGDINCGYQWAYQDLPELSAQFDQAVKSLIPQATAHATAFGENCLGNDGQVIRFLAMETDFYVIAPVQTLGAYETFGNWIAGVMQTVNELPSDRLVGPKPGFVEFRFEKSVSESLGLRVSIQQYNETAMGATGEELFHMFYAQP